MQFTDLAPEYRNYSIMYSIRYLMYAPISETRFIYCSIVLHI
jgi:hypothetical protein